MAANITVFRLLVANLNHGNLHAMRLFAVYSCLNGDASGDSCVLQRKAGGKETEEWTRHGEGEMRGG